MLPIYGLVALTMLKPVHRVFRSSDVFPPKNASGWRKNYIKIRKCFWCNVGISH